MPLLLVHGNLVTGGWWRYVAAALPDDVRVVAPDLRGFGRSEAKPIDATRGLGDMVDDVRSLLVALGWADSGVVNAAGWSMGGGVLWQYAVAYPDDLASMTMIAPVSPYGYGGTKGPTACHASTTSPARGGGGAAPEFVRRLAAGDRSEDDPATSPRVIMREYFGPRTNTANVDEEFLLDETLRTRWARTSTPGTRHGRTTGPGSPPAAGAS